jgi:hypothetical protein
MLLLCTDKPKTKSQKSRPGTCFSMPLVARPQLPLDKEKSNVHFVYHLGLTASLEKA